MKKIFVSIALIIFMQQLISCNLGKSEKYVDPFAFTINPTITLKNNSSALAIAFNSNGGDPLSGGNYLIDISNDGKIDTVHFTSSAGVDVTDLLNVIFIQNISADYTLIGFARNSGVANEAYLLNKNDKSLTSLKGNEIPVGMSGNGSPNKQFVISPISNQYYYIARVNHSQRLIKLMKSGSAFSSTIISKDTMLVDDFNVDKDDNAWTSYSPATGGSANDIIINSSGENLSMSKKFPQRNYWINANKEIVYQYQGTIYKCLYNVATNTLTYPALITNQSQVYIPQGFFSNARYSDYLYTFSDATVVIDDNTNLTILKNQVFNNVVSCDFAALSKKGVIAGSISSGSEALFTVTMENTTIQATKVINEGIYTFDEVEMLEDGTIYFSGKRLADGKNILAKRDVTGTVTVLSDAFLGTIEFIETTGEFTNRY